MTRMEENFETKNGTQDLQGEIDDLKKKLKRKQNKKLLSCGSCLFAFLFILLVLSGFGLYFLTLSGLATIPYLSEKIYSEPKPVYTVESTTSDNIDFASVLKKKIAGSFSNINRALNSEVALQFSEKQLSGTLKYQVEQNKTLSNYVDNLQVAVLPDNLELFVKLKNPHNVCLVADIAPKIENKKIVLAVTSFKIGDLTLPKSVGQAIISSSAGNILNTLASAISGFSQIQNISLSSKTVEIGLLITSLKSLF